MGHLKMMAAAQPFISGAISKTVNLPENITSEEIANIYLEGGKMGLKAIAIYRDGSKRTQPLNTLKKEKKVEATLEVQEEKIESTTTVSSNNKPYRRHLSDTRRAVTHKFAVAGHEGYITVGLYEDGKPGELFLTMSKEGSTLSGLMDAFATMVSVSLQYGVPLKDLVKKFSHMRFEPSGFTRNEDIPIAKSIIDYLFRWLGMQFLNVGDRSELGLADPSDDMNASVPAPTVAPVEEKKAIEETKAQPVSEVKSEVTYTSETFTVQVQEDAPSCADCGSLMVRNGACYKCWNCGSTSGCS
jgi:ribonucleoside-diphosphate reductase alpha chain